MYFLLVKEGIMEWFHHEVASGSLPKGVLFVEFPTFEAMLPSCHVMILRTVVLAYRLGFRGQGGSRFIRLEQMDPDRTETDR